MSFQNWYIDNTIYFRLTDLCQGEINNSSDNAPLAKAVEQPSWHRSQTSSLKLHTDAYMCTHKKQNKKYKTQYKQRSAQHMSCSPGKELHFWRTHSPPYPSLMRKLFKAPKVFAPVGLTARHSRSLSDKWLRTPHHWFQDCPKGSQSVQYSARHKYRRPLRESGETNVNQ